MNNKEPLKETESKNRNNINLGSYTPKNSEFAESILVVGIDTGINDWKVVIMLPQKTGSLDSRRTNVDKNVRNNRGISDKEFDDAVKSIEFTTDELIYIERSRADDAKSLARDLVDTARQIGQSHVGSATADAPNCSHLGLSVERQQFDSMMRQERNFVDRAIIEERGNRRLVERNVLCHERDLMDRGMITERRSADTETTSSTQLLAQERTDHFATRAALRTRDEFLAVVSHDLRGPLGALAMSADLLLDESKSGSDTIDIRQWINLVKRSAASMLRLVRDLLDLERVASGKLELQCAPHDMAAFVSIAIESFRVPASAKSISLVYDANCAVIVADCDYDRIMQVISNLVGNAIKFTPEGGTINLNVTNIQEDVQISVIDTGPGIPIDNQTRIFDRFCQLGEHSREGLGLGLYISKWIVDTHRGRIWVESTPGVGSAFHFTLPIKYRGPPHRP